MINNMNYYLKYNRIWMAKEKMPDKEQWDGLNPYWLKKAMDNWHSSLQPCEISESEMDKIISELNNARIIYPRKNELIEVTDMIRTEEIKTITKSGTITEYQLFFKSPKQVDGEIEAVEFAEWIHINAQPRLPNKNQWKMYNNSVVITTQELYEIFKKQK